MFSEELLSHYVRIQSGIIYLCCFTSRFQEMVLNLQLKHGYVEENQKIGYEVKQHIHTPYKVCQQSLPLYKNQSLY